MESHNVMYARIGEGVSTTITIGDDDRGTIRTVKGDDVHVRPLLFPAIVTFADSDVVTIGDRSKLDRIMEQKNYARFVLEG